MKRTAMAIMIALAAVLPSCGASLGGLLQALAAADPVPLQVRALCAPVLRDVDIQATVIEINTARDEGATKGTAIATAQQTCMDAAANLIAIQDPENPEVDAAEAARFEVDCVNCNVAIIDRLYD